MHLNEKCAGLSKTAIAAIIEIGANLLLFCNQCVATSRKELVLSSIVKETASLELPKVVSKKLKVTSGVPQGSRLGPLFFLANVDGLLEQTTSPTFAYADDIKLVCTNLRNTQQDICCIENWCIESDMKLNSDKVTELEIFKGEHQLVVNDQIVQKVRSQKDLGIIVTKNLSWNDHAEER